MRLSPEEIGPRHLMCRSADAEVASVKLVYEASAGVILA